MRIISGKFRGHKLVTPKSRDVRPATDRVRESIFNLIESRIDLEGIAVLDLFCGTGSLGLEAISRGAAHVTFVELDRNVIRIARENSSRLGVVGETTFLNRDARRFVRRCPDRFGLVFADPPYHLNGVAELPAATRKLLTVTGLFFLEHDKSLKFDSSDGLIESRKYGRTIVSIFGSIVEDR